MSLVYRTWAGSKLDKFYVGKRRASTEIVEFNEAIERDPWPLAQLNMRQNILHTPISLNAGNDLKILPSLGNACRKTRPSVESMKLAKWAQSTSVDKDISSPLPQDIQDTQSNSSKEPASENGNAKYILHADTSTTECETEDTCSDLAKYKIIVRRMTVSEYIREFLSPNDSTNCDMALTEPPSFLPASEVAEAICL